MFSSCPHQNSASNNCENVLVFLNRDLEDTGSRILMRNIRNIEQLFEKINSCYKDISLPAPITELYYAETGRRLNSLLHLKNGQKLVAVPAGQLFCIPPSGYQSKQDRIVGAPRVTANDSFTKPKLFEVTIFIFKNGAPNHPPKTLIVPKRYLDNWARTLTFIVRRLEIYCGIIKSLYTNSGVKVTGSWQIQNGCSYVGVGYNEEFIADRYIHNFKAAKSRSYKGKGRNKWTPTRNQRNSKDVNLPPQISTETSTESAASSNRLRPYRQTPYRNISQDSLQDDAFGYLSDPESFMAMQSKLETDQNEIDKLNLAAVCRAEQEILNRMTESETVVTTFKKDLSPIVNQILDSNMTTLKQTIEGIEDPLTKHLHTINERNSDLAISGSFSNESFYNGEKRTEPTINDKKGVESFINDEKRAGPFINDTKRVQSFANNEKRTGSFANDINRAESFINDTKRVQSFANDDKRTGSFANDINRAESFINDTKRVQSFANDDKRTGSFANDVRTAGSLLSNDVKRAGSPFSNDVKRAGSSFSNDVKIAGSSFSNDVKRAGSSFSNDVKIAGSSFSNDVKRAGSSFSNDVKRAGSSFSNDVKRADPFINDKKRTGSFANDKKRLESFAKDKSKVELFNNDTKRAESFTNEKKREEESFSPDEMELQQFINDDREFNLFTNDETEPKPLPLPFITDNKEPESFTLHINKTMNRKIQQLFSDFDEESDNYNTIDARPSRKTNSCNSCMQQVSSTTKTFAPFDTKASILFVGYTDSLEHPQQNHVDSKDNLLLCDDLEDASFVSIQTDDIWKIRDVMCKCQFTQTDPVVIAEKVSEGACEVKKEAAVVQFFKKTWRKLFIRKKKVEVKVASEEPTQNK